MVFKKVKILGHPYHGLVTNSTLLLPNGNIIPYVGLTNGDIQLISLPNPPTLTRTPTQQSNDQTQGFEWRNYAIVADNHLGGVNLGSDWLLYIDPNQVVWYLKIGYQTSGNECAMNCTLQSVFGRFNGEYPQASRLLVAAQTTLIPSGILRPLNRFTFERKPDGSQVFIHIYAKLDNGNTIDFPESMSLYEVWRLQLEGNGLLTHDDSLGEGIKATLSLYKSFEEIQSHIKRTIPRTEKRFKVGKINVIEGYDPKPAEPPACETNIYRTTFDLKLIPEGDEYIPFALDKNTYIKSNWYGQENTKTAIVRMLYDSGGNIHTLGIQRKAIKKQRVLQDFQGSGSGKSSPIEYEFNQHVCVVKGFSPGVIEQYEGTQQIDVRLKRINTASLLLDGGLVKTLTLYGENRQTAKTIIGQPVVNKVTSQVKMNERVLRKIDAKPGEISTKYLPILLLMYTMTTILTVFMRIFTLDYCLIIC